MEESKIKKIYRFKEKDENDREFWLFCYALEDERGKVTYHFTKDEDKATEVIKKYLNDHYNRINFKREIAKTPSIFNLNCSSVDEVAEKVKETSEDEKYEMKAFNKAKDKFYDNDFEEVEEKKGIVTRTRSYLGNFAKRRIAGFKNASIKGKVARVVATVAAVTLFANGCSAFLNRSKSPTNNDLSSPITPDNNDNNDNDDTIKHDIDNNVVKISDAMKEAATIADQALKETEAKIKAEEEAKKIAQTDSNTSNNTSYDSSRNTTSSTSSGTSSSSGGSSTQSTKPNKEAGSINEGYLEVQDPSAGLNDSSNNSSNDNDNTSDIDDPYQNVTEEEKPITDEDNTTNEDYSEEIEVPAKEDAILDSELEGNEGAIDDDVSYDINIDDNNGEYDNVYVEELPDPNKTAEAGDKDYVTTDEELEQDTSLEDESQNIDVVPVEQTPVQATDANTDDSTVTVDTTYIEPGTIETVPVEQSATINEQEIERAVEAMANGEEGNVVVNADGSICFETVENTETNSMTK